MSELEDALEAQRRVRNVEAERAEAAREWARTVRAMYRHPGHTIRTVAAELGISVGRVHQLVKQANEADQEEAHE